MLELACSPGYNILRGTEQMVDGLIKSDPKVLMGKPVIAGTRIPVELILEKLAAGETVEQIMQAYPRLTEEGIRAALAFAAQAIRADVIYLGQEAAVEGVRAV